MANSNKTDATTLAIGRLAAILASTCCLGPLVLTKTTANAGYPSSVKR